jgi:GWxTD domain-containing protein
VLDRDSVLVRRLTSRERVRIPSFAETSRTDESVVVQHAVAVPPGSYVVQLRASDVNSGRGFRMTDTLTAPAYGAGATSLSPPLLVYEALGRRSRGALPAVILNPRHTVAYGGDEPLLYLEAYGVDEPVAVTIVGEAGDTIWQTSAVLAGGEGQLGHALVAIPHDVLPLGRFWVAVGAPHAPPQRRPLVMTISDQWMVANFDEVLQILRYVAHSDELAALRTGTATERRDAWEAFWARRDPLPITGINEFRDQFFHRVRFATEAFRESGRAGWLTARGEVYIVLGPPDAALERFVGRTDGTGRPNAEEWIYSSTPAGRLTLLFHDRSGFGRLELAPSSAATFRNVAERMKPRRARD